MTRSALTFACGDDELVGIVDLPQTRSTRGVLIIVGGPQYRVGSHRQFALLATHLVSSGYPVFRFDHRGVGDSSGKPREFDDIGPDIRAAIDEFTRLLPELTEIVIWGLCDAASAAMIYAAEDERVCGLVLLNPWVRSEEGLARTYMRHYYLEQLFSAAFWGRLVSGDIRVLTALRSFLSNVRKALGSRKAKARDRDEPQAESATQAFQVRMRDGLSRYRGKTLIITSGDDLTATEFEALVRARRWRRLLRRRSVARRRLEAANHTFSKRVWRDTVAEWTSDWLKTW